MSDRPLPGGQLEIRDGVSGRRSVTRLPPRALAPTVRRPDLNLVRWLVEAGQFGVGSAEAFVGPAVFGIAL
jgi:hypothetical protein